jgi:hypothetical protein
MTVALTAVGGGVHDALGLIRVHDWRLLGAVGYWLFDNLVLYARDRLMDDNWPARRHRRCPGAQPEVGCGGFALARLTQAPSPEPFKSRALTFRLTIRTSVDGQGRDPISCLDPGCGVWLPFRNSSGGRSRGWL